METTGPQTWFTRTSRLLWWLVPIVFLFWLYSDGLKTWFMKDDFNWLGMIRRVHNLRDLFGILFTPVAQGTIRPWSDRGFFLLFEALFGLNSLPYRIFVFITVAADVALIAWLTRRITRSAAAGFFAAILWTANSALVTVMVWSSAYDHALCLLFLLAAMALFIEYAETGHRIFWWGQATVFVVGFGALEVNVVYPALAAAFVLFASPPEKRGRLMRSLIPLFCISVAYFLIHFAVAPPLKDGPYAIHVDSRIFRALAVYCNWSLLPALWREEGHSAFMGVAIVLVTAAALTVFAVRQVAKPGYTVLFFASWFLITLAPMIPLPGNRADYYLTIPLAGLAMLGGLGLSQALGSFRIRAIAVVIPLSAYLIGMIPVTRAATRQWLNRSLAVRDLVIGVEGAHAADPAKTIVLNRISSTLYDDAIYISAFYPVGVDRVYLTPGSEDTIHSTGDPVRLSRMVLDPGTLRHAIAHDQIAVYSEAGGHLRNDTAIWARADQPGFDQIPRRIDVGSPLFAWLLGPEWFPPQSGLRRMPQRATVRLGGPRSADEKLLLEGYCPDLQLKADMPFLSLSVDGIPLPDTPIDNPETRFRRLLAVPPALVGRPSVELTISVNSLFHDSGDNTGLFFGTIAFERWPGS